MKEFIDLMNQSVRSLKIEPTNEKKFTGNRRQSWRKIAKYTLLVLLILCTRSLDPYHCPQGLFRYPPGQTLTPTNPDGSGQWAWGKMGWRHKRLTPHTPRPDLKTGLDNRPAGQQADPHA